MKLVLDSIGSRPLNCVLITFLVVLIVCVAVTIALIAEANVCESTITAFLTNPYFHALRETSLPVALVNISSSSSTPTERFPISAILQVLYMMLFKMASTPQSPPVTIKTQREKNPFTFLIEKYIN
jgi:hypothetical protein